MKKRQQFHLILLALGLALFVVMALAIQYRGPIGDPQPTWAAPELETVTPQSLAPTTTGWWDALPTPPTIPTSPTQSSGTVQPTVSPTQ